MAKNYIKYSNIHKHNIAELTATNWPKGSTFYPSCTHHYAVIQDGKYIGATDSRRIYGKEVKLNKKFFPELKCGLFSKRTKTLIYALESKIHIPEYSAKSVNIRYLKWYEEVNISIRTVLTVKDPEKVYKCFIENTGMPFYSYDALKKTYNDLVEELLHAILYNSDVARRRYHIDETTEMDKDDRLIFDYLVKLLKEKFADIGYEATITLSNRFNKS